MNSIKNIKIGWNGKGRWALLTFSNIHGSYCINREKTIYLPFVTIQGKVTILTYQQTNKLLTY